MSELAQAPSMPENGSLKHLWAWEWRSLVPLGDSRSRQARAWFLKVQNWARDLGKLSKYPDPATSKDAQSDAAEGAGGVAALLRGRAAQAFPAPSSESGTIVTESSHGHLLPVIKDREMAKG